MVQPAKLILAAMMLTITSSAQAQNPFDLILRGLLNGDTEELFEGDFYQDRRYQERRRRDAERNWRHRTVIVPEPEILPVRTQLTPGNIYISTNQLKLFYALDDYRAIVYPIAVGKQGFEWSGTEKITAIKRWPDWRPPDDMRRRDPRLPVLVEGGPRNPLGAAALYLGDTLYRIHGTNDPNSIGTRTSSGCIRMHNEHVLHLMQRVKVGTVVVVK